MTDMELVGDGDCWQQAGKGRLQRAKRGCGSRGGGLRAGSEGACRLRPWRVSTHNRPPAQSVAAVSLCLLGPGNPCKKIGDQETNCSQDTGGRAKRKSLRGK